MRKLITNLAIILLVFFAYTLTLKAIENTNVNNFEIDNGIISPEFSGDIYDYAIHLPAGTSEINLIASTKNGVAVIGEGKRVVNDDDVFNITVLSETGNVFVYNFHVYIDSITVNNISFANIDFEFNPLVYNYNIEVSYNVKKAVANISKKDNQTYTMSENTNLQVGTNKIEIEITEPGKKNQTYTFNIKRKEPYRTLFEYSGTYKDWTVPETGYYRIELWGANGGGTKGGQGGYTAGDVYLEKDRELYIYIGGQGTVGSTGRAGGGYNGGGNAQIYQANDRSKYGGGGATDIRTYRTTDGNWNNFDSLKSRIMVAAGGGGYTLEYVTEGLHGGGLVGYAGGGYSCGQGGTQTKGGSGYAGSYGTSGSGTFGQGGYGNSHASGGGGY